MRKYLLISAFLVLAACSTIQQLYTDVPKEVATAQASLAAAEHTALIYASLPACGKAGVILCRDPAVTKKIGAADTVAFNALQAARQAETETALQAAQTAIGLLTSITNNLPTGGN